MADKEIMTQEQLMASVGKVMKGLKDEGLDEGQVLLVLNCAGAMHNSAIVTKTTLMSMAAALINAGGGR